MKEDYFAENKSRLVMLVVMLYCTKKVGRSRLKRIFGVMWLTEELEVVMAKKAKNSQVVEGMYFLYVC